MVVDTGSETVVSELSSSFFLPEKVKVLRGSSRVSEVKEERGHPYSLCVWRIRTPSLLVPMFRDI